MKRILPVLMCVAFLCGCSSGNAALDAGHRLRSNVLSANCCTFLATITADYGDELYSFDMQCEFDKSGGLKFTVTSPESISGITGKIDAQAGAFTFDEHLLAFPMLADGQITPITAPWVLMKTVRGGYIASCTKDNDGFYLQLDDSYEEDRLTVDLWIDQSGNLSHGEFLWDGRRILSVKVSDFKLM